MKVKDLYKVDILAFNSKIGYITNLGTTFYAMQSQYPMDSEEYKEINNRLKLCCIEQNRTIDAAKGLKTKEFPKHWTKYQKILETDSEEEKAKKIFENKLVIEKRPAFMRNLYSHYLKEYKIFKEDFDNYSYAIFGKPYDNLTEEDKKSEKYKELKKYYDRCNPLLETDCIMNKLCNYITNETKTIKSKKERPNQEELFETLYNPKIELDEKNLQKISEIKNEYENFKKTKQLKESEFSTYEQYYKYLRNKCLETISSNIQELANLAIYLCYKQNPTKPKDFCWDVFGAGIVENLKEKNKKIKIPQLCDDGDVEYLGDRYKFVEISLDETDDEFGDNMGEIGDVDDDLSVFEGLDDFGDDELC